jgi:hypothetical protein
MDAPQDSEGVRSQTQSPENPSNPVRKRTNSWEQTNAIVYDASSQTLTKEERRNVGGDRQNQNSIKTIRLTTA